MENPKYDDSYIDIWRAVVEIETGVRPTLALGYWAREKANLMAWEDERKVIYVKQGSSK